MRKILLVIDMQKDFVDGALGTAEAVAASAHVRQKIQSFDAADVFATMDTHFADYMDTQEGHFRPVPHCIKGTEGWELHESVRDLLRDVRIFEKSSFGSGELVRYLCDLRAEEELEIEIVGLCTDVCVVTHALMLKALMPEVRITADASCCAGITPEGHRAALQTMRACQIVLTNE